MVYTLAYSTSDLGSIPSLVIWSEQESISFNLLFPTSHAKYQCRWEHVKNHLCNHGFWDRTQWRTCGSLVLRYQSKSQTLKHTLPNINTKRRVNITLQFASEIRYYKTSLRYEAVFVPHLWFFFPFFIVRTRKKYFILARNHLVRTRNISRSNEKLSRSNEKCIRLKEKSISF